MVAIAGDLTDAVCLDLKYKQAFCFKEVACPFCPSTTLDFLRGTELEFTECVQFCLRTLGALGFHLVAKILC